MTAVDDTRWRNTQRALLDLYLQLSLNNLVVNASLTLTILGCRMRRHLSSTLNAVSFPSLKPGGMVCKLESEPDLLSCRRY